MPGGSFEGRLVGVRVESFGRGVNAQRLRVAFGEAVRRFEALGFRPDLRERVALEGGKLANRRVERVLRVEDGLRRRRDAVELCLERGDAGRGPADASGNRAHSVGVVRGPIVQVFVAVGDEVFARHARTLQRCVRKSLADCGVGRACGNGGGDGESRAGGFVNEISASPGVIGDSPAAFGASPVAPGVARTVLPQAEMPFAHAEIVFSQAEMRFGTAETLISQAETSSSTLA